MERASFGAAEGLGSQTAEQLAKSQGSRAYSVRIQSGSDRGKKNSLADLIVLAGNAGVEQAAKAAGLANGAVRGRPHGRPQARRMSTPCTYLEPVADGFETSRRPAMWCPPRLC